MKLMIELDREVDGRWIAEVPELNVLLYGDSKQDAIQRDQSAAREIVLDRIRHRCVISSAIPLAPKHKEIRDALVRPGLPLQLGQISRMPAPPTRLEIGK